jgi:hypothetical protein
MLAKVNRSLLLPLLTPTGLRAVLLALVLGMALFLLVIMNLTVGGRNEHYELMMMEQFKEEEQSVEVLF